MNPARRPLIAGNWKMNAGGGDGCELAAGIAKAAAAHDGVDVLVGPPFTAIAAVTHELEQAKSAVQVAAQNMHEEASGAFTGEISAAMLQDAGAKWVILGHSERRHIFGESDELIFKKLAAANAAELIPIVCVGETLDQREAGQTLEVVGEQVRAVIDELGAGGRPAVVAYEPVWAIGTGKVAKPEDAQEVHAAIRKLLAEASEELAEQTRILYGGSVKPNNAEGLLSQPDIDGALVGGASLKADSFGKIIQVAGKLAAQGAADAEAEARDADAGEEPAAEAAAEEPAADAGAEAEAAAEDASAEAEAADADAAAEAEDAGAEADAEDAGAEAAAEEAAAEEAADGGAEADAEDADAEDAGAEDGEEAAAD